MRSALLFVAGFATAVGALAVSAELHDRAVRRHSASHLMVPPMRSERNEPLLRGNRNYPNFGESEHR